MPYCQGQQSFRRKKKSDGTKPSKISGKIDSNDKSHFKLNLDVDDENSDKVQMAAELMGGKFTLFVDDDMVHMFSRSDEGGISQRRLLVDDKTPKLKYKVVGYELRGPTKGPFVVVVEKSNQSSATQQDSNISSDSEALLYRNVGGNH